MIGYHLDNVRQVLYKYMLCSKLKFSQILNLTECSGPILNLTNFLPRQILNLLRRSVKF
jgi:hypothetical protein